MNDEQRQDYYDRKVEKHTKTAMLFGQFLICASLCAVIYWSGRAMGWWE